MFSLQFNVTEASSLTVAGIIILLPFLTHKCNRLAATANKHRPWRDDLLAVVLFWEAPFMLNITDRQSDGGIMYKLFISSYDNSSFEVYNTSSTQLVYNYTASINLSLSICNNEAVPLIFQLSTINRVGISQRSEPISLRDEICPSGIHNT